MARRRGFNVISMAFLDAMTCGFGAVILFFMIITANVDIRSDEILEDRSAEVDRLELQVEVGKRSLAQLRLALADMLTSMAETAAARDQLRAEIEDTREELEELLEDSSASEEEIEQLEGDLARLEEETESLAANPDTTQQTGNFIRQIQGEGYRQYLTGLRMGGERILILVDMSTSMLDRTVVNVLLRRNFPVERKRLAPKWRQVVDTVEWLTAQIEPGTQFQVVVFNRDAWTVLEGTDGQWLTAEQDGDLDEVVATLREMVPGMCIDGRTDDRTCGATNLYAAFQAMRSFSPWPDNVFLLVDGLPTINNQYPSRSVVSGRERYEHFRRAMQEVPRGIPVNVLLYALEGDPYSGPAYWTLALQSGGSLMAPSEDWP